VGDEARGGAGLARAEDDFFVAPELERRVEDALGAAYAGGSWGARV
jgi:hypothetical protein